MEQNKVSRRKFLELGGALSVIAVGGSACVAREGEGEVYRPWSDWDKLSPYPLPLVGAGILASNPHNTQPWRFRVTQSRIDLFADLGRSLGAMDPYHREMMLGLGCALENMCLSSRLPGMGTYVSLMPDRRNGSFVARLDLVDWSEDPPVKSSRRQPRPSSALYTAIPFRHTDRAAYTNRTISDEDFRELLSLPDPETTGPARLHLFRRPNELPPISALTVEATEQIIADREMSRASAAWGLRKSAEFEKLRDGIRLEDHGLPRYKVRLEDWFPISEQAGNRYWLEATRDRQCATAAAYGIISVPKKYDRVQTLQAGRLWQRIHLRASFDGLSVQPLNQAVEVADREIELKKKTRFGDALRSLTGPGHEATFLFRIGHSNAPENYSPRRPVSAVVEQSPG